jgi:uncharacterized membrane protein YphA (DoxX/SURF4 family)
MIHDVETTGRDRALAAIRVAFGVIWAVDASLKWMPSFRDGFMGRMERASIRQPGLLQPWFHFWQWAVAPQPRLFALLTAVIETAVAVALVLGLWRRVTCTVGAAFSLLIWSTAERFGGPYGPHSTDVGTSIVYVLVFLVLLAVGDGAWRRLRPRGMVPQWRV